MKQNLPLLSFLSVLMVLLTLLPSRGNPVIIGGCPPPICPPRPCPPIYGPSVVFWPGYYYPSSAWSSRPAFSTEPSFTAQPVYEVAKPIALPGEPVKTYSNVKFGWK